MKKYWIVLIALEALLFIYYKISQPNCEPCLPNQDCRPCISSEQIVVIWIGFMVGVAVLVWRLIDFYKKKYGVLPK